MAQPGGESVTSAGSRTKYKYRALRTRQTAGGADIVLFAAPAVEIHEWAGVPQKREFGGQESPGFQRELDTGRVRQLEGFLTDDKNVVQNPLLCAKRESASGGVQFVPDTGQGADARELTGWIEIESERLEDLRLDELLRRVRLSLEARVSSLAGKSPPTARVSELRSSLAPGASTQQAVEREEDPDAEAAEDAGEVKVDDATEAVQSVFSDQSHIQDFWEEVAAREVVLRELGDGYSESQFAGFSAEALIAFLRPVLLVDGQHRLEGAVATAVNRASTPEALATIDNAVSAGRDPIAVERRLQVEHSRHLPVSLLAVDDPAEHVFQFVVVNQKATPIKRALLGTIVSTTLSNEELERVAVRLARAKIPLEDSRAIAYLTRHEKSPFYGLVERGLAKMDKDLLPWSVMSSLISIFRYLKGAKLYHERKVDYADQWRRKYLDECPLVSTWSERGYASPMEFWSSPDGPWRTVFVAFWAAVRARLGATSDPEAGNYWGRAKSSQLFNKISLTILAADFFQYFLATRSTVSEPAEDSVRELVEQWLEDVDDQYFGRRWPLSGIKKESIGIRRQWASLWAEYRKAPTRLPPVKEYRVSKGDQ